MNYNLKNHIQITEFLEYIADIRKYSAHTVRNYNIDLMQFIVYLYKCDKELLILDVHKENIQEYMFSGICCEASSFQMNVIWGSVNYAMYRGVR